MTYFQLLREGPCPETQDDAELSELYMTRSTTDVRCFFGFVFDYVAVQSYGGAPVLLLMQYTNTNNRVFAQEKHGA